MDLRERLRGEWWWMLNMGVLGEVGSLGSLLRCIGWEYGRILCGVGGSFQVLLDLRCEMALRLDYDMIYGVGI
jgi:hypothetical protein